MGTRILLKWILLELETAQGLVWLQGYKTKSGKGLKIYALQFSFLPKILL